MPLYSCNLLCECQRKCWSAKCAQNTATYVLSVLSRCYRSRCAISGWTWRWRETSAWPSWKMSHQVGYLFRFATASVFGNIYESNSCGGVRAENLSGNMKMKLLLSLYLFIYLYLIFIFMWFILYIYVWVYIQCIYIYLKYLKVTFWLKFKL